MPLDSHPNDELCQQRFPQLWEALLASEKCLKKIRRLRNQGRANDLDVEHVRDARDLLRNVVVAGNWTRPG